MNLLRVLKLIMPIKRCLHFSLLLNLSGYAEFKFPVLEYKWFHGKTCERNKKWYKNPKGPYTLHTKLQRFFQMNRENCCLYIKL